MKHRRNPKHEYRLVPYLLLKSLWVLLALLLTQLFFALCNHMLFHVASVREGLTILWGNVRFGLSTTALCLLPFLVLMLIPTPARYTRGYRAVSNVLYWAGSLAATVPTLCDAGYYAFTYRRLSSEIFSYLTIGGHMGSLGPQFLLSFWYIVLFALVLLVVMIVLNRRTQLKDPAGLDTRRGVQVAGMVVGLALCCLCLGGGRFALPLVDRSESARYCSLGNTTLVTNSTYNIAWTAMHPQLQQFHFFDTVANDTMLMLFNPTFHPIGHTTRATATPSHPVFVAGGGRYHDNSTDSVERFSNVVILILESFSQEYMGCYTANMAGHYESFTPFLDSLALHSHLYNGHSNGKKSIESIPAVMASVPTLMEEPLVLSRYCNNRFSSLPLLLQDYGYTTAFFHGSYNGVMSFDTFCYHIGFQHYYGQTEYEQTVGNADDYDGNWGIFDEPYLQYLAHRLDSLPEPFFVGEFTLSSHHPYTIPEAHKGQFKKGKHPLLECVNYTDYSLSRFFHEAARHPWFEHTLFIIMGDHPGKAITAPFTGYTGAYRIPMMFYLPAEHFGGSASSRIVQQTDVMPTLIDYLGLYEPSVCFGTSLFQTTAGFQVVYGDGYYLLQQGDAWTTLSVSQKGRVYSEESNPAKPLLPLLQSIVQQYNDRMAHDRLSLNTNRRTMQ